MKKIFLALFAAGLLLLTVMSVTAIFIPSNGGLQQNGGLILGTPLLSGGGFAAGTPDINLSFGPSVSNFRWQGCSPQYENASSQPEGQTIGTGIDFVCNNGTAVGIIGISNNAVPNSGWKIYASTTGPTKDTLLNTSFQTIYTGVLQNTCRQVWLVANCSFVTANPGVWEIYTID